MGIFNFTKTLKKSLGGPSTSPLDSIMMFDMVIDPKTWTNSKARSLRLTPSFGGRVKNLEILLS